MTIRFTNGAFGKGYLDKITTLVSGSNVIETVALSGSSNAVEWKYYYASGSNVRFGNIRAAYDSAGPSVQFDDMGPGDVGTVDSEFSINVEALATGVRLVVSSSGAGMTFKTKKIIL